MGIKCPECGSKNVIIVDKGKTFYTFTCDKGHKFTVPFYGGRSLGGILPFARNPEVLKKEAWGAVTPQNAGKVATTKQGITATSGKEAKKGPRGKEFGMGGRSLKTIIFTGITVILIFLNPLLDQVKSSLLGVAAVFYPDIADYFEWVFMLLSLLLMGLVAYAVWTTNSTIVGILLMVGIVALAVFIPIITTYSESVGGTNYLASMSCLFQNIGNSQGLTSCQIESGATSVEYEKVGSYEVLTTNLDTTYTGNIVYAGKDNAGNENINFDTYILPIVIENPSDTETIYNFAILTGSTTKSVLKRGGAIKTAEKITLAYLAPMEDMCTETALCSIQPKEKLRLTLKATPRDYCKDITSQQACLNRCCIWDENSKTCTLQDICTTAMDATIKYSYDYSGEGRFDFIVAESDDSLKPLLQGRSNPTSSKGPIDVKVYFVPNYYVIPKSTSQELPKLSALVILSNHETGKAKIKSPITIRRLSDGILKKSDTCTAPWGEEVDLTSVDGLSENLDISSCAAGGVCPLERSHTYICKYGIEISELQSTPEDEARLVPFIAKVDYTYTSTITKKNIEVVRETRDLTKI